MRKAIQAKDISDETIDDLMMGRWRDKNERAVLVERVIAAERRARVAEEKVRALMGDEDRLTVMAARLVELEEIVQRQNTKIAELNRKKAS